jgi:hypothetical protein
LDIVWQENEVEQYERLKQLAASADELLPEYLKSILRRHLNKG